MNIVRNGMQLELTLQSARRETANLKGKTFPKFSTKTVGDEKIVTYPSSNESTHFLGEKIAQKILGQYLEARLQAAWTESQTPAAVQGMETVDEDAFSTYVESEDFCKASSGQSEIALLGERVKELATQIGEARKTKDTARIKVCQSQWLAASNELASLKLAKEMKKLGLDTPDEGGDDITPVL